MKKNVFDFSFKVCKDVIYRWIIGKTQPIFRTGTHLITGYPGAGKTLLANYVINNVDSSKYFFISNKDQFIADNVYNVDIWDLFDNNEQILKLPIKDKHGRKLYGLIIDEVNLKFNRRLNRGRDYNNLFIGLMELLITRRHQGIPRVYFIGQKLELQDTQLISMVKYQHNIAFNKTKYYYKMYKLDDRVMPAPKKLFIEEFQKELNDELVYQGISKVKINYQILSSYNTFGLSKDYINLKDVIEI